MHISKIEITNFRNFGSLSMARLGPTTVVIGENNVGKSNLLHALRLVLDPSLPDSERMLRAEDFWDRLEKPFDGNEIKVVIELRGYDKDQAAKASLAGCTVFSKPLTSRLTYVYRPVQDVGDDNNQPDNYEFIVFGGTNDTKRIGHDVRRFVSIRVLPALRDVSRDLQNWGRSPLRNLIERVRKSVPEERLAALEEVLGDATEKLLEEPLIGALDDAISARVQAIARGAFSFETEFSIAASGPDQVFRALRLSVSGEKTRSVDEASLGRANILYLALLLENLERSKSAGEIADTLLAVEEPEAHLHPHLQRLVFRYFLEQNPPLFLTTHSPHIASVTPLRSAVILRDVPDKGSRAFTIRTATGLSKQARRDLERYLDVTRAELLFARGVVLVEGVAELYIVPTVGTLMGVDLDTLGVTIAAVHGTDFGPYVALLGPKGLQIPFVIVTDGDGGRGLKRGQRLVDDDDLAVEIKEDISEGRDGKARTALRKANVFVGASELELDLLTASPAALKKTYRQLVLGSGARQAFSAAVDAFLDGDASAGLKVMKRIEQIGKGRFAQRLAPKIKDIDPPEYLVRAIKGIVALVT